MHPFQGALHTNPHLQAPAVVVQATDLLQLSNNVQSCQGWT